MLAHGCTSGILWHHLHVYTHVLTVSDNKRSTIVQAQDNSFLEKYLIYTCTGDQIATQLEVTTNQ